MDFKELGLAPYILKALERQGYRTPTPIQSGAIPPALAGRDVLGIAQTGTGKTCAFATPILQRLAAGTQVRPRVIRSLILTPTRELALQIQESFEAYGAGSPLKSAVIFGGVGQQPQVEKLKAGVDILVATPGRLLDLQGQGLLDLAKVEIFVLDEADRMLDMGFVHDVRRVLKLLPQKKQTLFFSATMPPEVQGLVNDLLHDYAKVAVTPVSSPVEVIRQSLYYVDKPNKTKLLAHLIGGAGVKNALVFSRTKHGANKVAGDLVKAGVSAAAIHGNKSQTARVQALTDFKSGRIKVLVATDIAARGIDIEELSHVFNYNLPDVPETYVHRIGRTGRAGRGGTAISFCDISEKEELKAIEKLLGKSIPVVEDHPWPMTNFEPPKRDKNGKIVNPEDAEARQAARERKAQRKDRRDASDGPQGGQKQAAVPKEKARRAPAENAKKTIVIPTAKAPRSPKELRQSAGYKASKSLDEALAAMSPRDPAPSPSDLSKDEAFRRWMEEERRIQAQKGFADPLAGEEIMDATARLLAPKREDRRAVSPQEDTRRGPAGRRDGTKPPQIRGKRELLQGEFPSAEGTKMSKRRGTKADSAPDPRVTRGKKPAASSKRRDAEVKAAPKKAAAAPVKASPAPKKAHPSKSSLTLEERKAKIRAAAKERRAKGPAAPALRPSNQKDSTEQSTLMKPYYLNDD